MKVNSDLMKLFDYNYKKKHKLRIANSSLKAARQRKGKIKSYDIKKIGLTIEKKQKILDNTLWYAQI